MAVLKHKKWLGIILVVGVLLWAVPSLSSASEKAWLFEHIMSPVFPYELQVPLGSRSSVDSEGDVSALGVYISELYKFFVSAAAIVAVVSIMFAGLQRITSQGNPEMISKSNEQITQALFGLAIALLSYIIVNTINPQLLRLDALKIENVNYSAIEITGLLKLCPASLGVTCGSSKDLAGGGVCWGLGRTSGGSAGLDQVCQVSGFLKIFAPDPEKVITSVLSSANPIDERGNGSEIIYALHQDGWEEGEQGTDFRSPIGGFTTPSDRQIIFPSWCGNTLSSLPDGVRFNRSTESCDGSTRLDCGKIIKSDVQGKHLLYYLLGTSCETVDGIRQSCVLNLSQVGFSSSGGSDSDGIVKGVSCQVAN